MGLLYSTGEVESDTDSEGIPSDSESELEFEDVSYTFVYFLV